MEKRCSHRGKKGWLSEPRKGIDLHVQLIYLYDKDPIDVDNIIKPILDSLVGLVYDDDSCITDVESHRRSLIGTFDLTRLPRLLISALSMRKECVYVRITDAKPLEEYL